FTSKLLDNIDLIIEYHLNEIEISIKWSLKQEFNANSIQKEQKILNRKKGNGGKIFDAKIYVKLLPALCFWKSMRITFLRDPRFYQYMPHSSRHSGHHHDRKMLPKPRHRYQHPPTYPVDMSMKRPHHRHRRHRSHRHRHQHGSSNSKFEAEMLKLHNYFRARHCAPPLVISQQLNQIAQSYAEYLAATSTFEHSGNQLGNEPLGENLYMQWISYGRVKASARDAIQSWYDEIAMHDFDRPIYSSETGHFTQMVWRSSRKLGVGVAYSPDGREVYIVANYYPGGNIVNRGYFESNVLPPNC
ncbi:unnamed protein product, partial [Rotaria sp. Silwood2]